MVSNPYAKFRDECGTALKGALGELCPKNFNSLINTTPPTREFGELRSLISFELAKQVLKKPIEIANQICMQRI